VGLLSILKSPGTWAVMQNVPQLVTSGVDSPFSILSARPSPNVNHKNEVTDALDCVLLYWGIRLTVNSGSSTPDPFISFRLRRNSATTLATISFEPQTIGTKAQLLNIPFTGGEHFNYEIEQFGSGNTFYTALFAGKMTAPTIP